MDMVWNIDTWILTKEAAEAVPLGFDVNKLSMEQKDKILLIKAQLNELGKYGRKSTYYSAEIYKAVVESGVSAAQQFENWHQKHC